MITLEQVPVGLLDKDEDIYQEEYPAGIVDIGWYPACDPQGCFKIRHVVNRDWQRPRVTIEVKDREQAVDWFNTISKGVAANRTL